MLLYSSSPVRMVVGEVEIMGIQEGPADRVGEQAKDAAEISREYFDSYYAGRNRVVVYCLGDVKRYNPPRTLTDYGIRVTPQSWQYIEG